MSQINPSDPHADVYRLRIAVTALQRIAAFNHAPGCEGSAPIYECCCYDRSQWDIAADALANMFPDEQKP